MNTCRICHEREARTEDRRTVCDVCLGIQPARELEPATEKEKAEMAICEQHGEHQGTSIAGVLRPHVCPQCTKEKRDQRYAEAKLKKDRLKRMLELEKKESVSITAIPHFPPDVAPSNGAVILAERDFASCPEMLKQIQTLAKDEFRTPAGQILWYLKIYLGNQAVEP